jgi:hypothetical protein
MVIIRASVFNGVISSNLWNVHNLMVLFPASFSHHCFCRHNMQSRHTLVSEPEVSQKSYGTCSSGQTNGKRSTLRRSKPNINPRSQKPSNVHSHALSHLKRQLSHFLLMATTTIETSRLSVIKLRAIGDRDPTGHCKKVALVHRGVESCFDFYMYNEMTSRWDWRHVKQRIHTICTFQTVIPAIRAVQNTSSSF